MNRPADWLDVLPHRIQVRGAIELDDYGYPVNEGSTTKTYACLLDDSVSVSFGQTGVSVTPQRVAYVMPYPIDEQGNLSDTVTLIASSGTVITVEGTEHEIVSVATHFDETGNAHNQEVRYV